MLARSPEIEFKGSTQVAKNTVCPGIRVGHHFSIEIQVPSFINISWYGIEKP